MRPRNSISFLAFLGFLFIFYSSGCATLEQRVSTLVGSGKYAEALEQLEKARAGRHPSTDLPNDAKKAREVFATAVERAFEDRVKAALYDGLAQKAEREASEGALLCEWSAKIKELQIAQRQLVSDINETEVIWGLLKGHADVPNCRKYLLAASRLRKYLADSPAAKNALLGAGAVLIDDWKRRLDPLLKSADPSWIPQLREDLTIADIPEQFRDEFIRQADMFCQLPLRGVGELTEPGLSRCCSTLIVAADSISRCIDQAPVSTDQELLPIMIGAYEEWTEASLPRLLKNGNSSRDLIDDLESLAARERPTLGPRSRHSLAQMHLRYAETFLAQDNLATLALVHGARARALGESEQEVQGIETRARATLSACSPLTVTLGIECDTHIDPVLVPMITHALQVGIERRTAAWHAWQFTDPVHGHPEFLVKIDQATLLVPSAEQLYERRSQYLSHFQDVPNPYKISLAAQVDVAAAWVNSCRASYNAYVAAHNAYPTYYSLMNVTNRST